MAKRLFEVDVEADSFIKRNGLPSRYLKADGSDDFGQRQIHNHVAGELILNGLFRTKTVILGAVDGTIETQPIEILITEDACETEDTLHIIATQFSGTMVFGQNVEYIFNGTRTNTNFQINVGDEIWIKAIEQNLFTIAVTRLQQATTSLFQRPVKFITAATYNFITADKDKTLVVTSEDAITFINLLQNVFAVNDEIELYDKTDGHKTRIYPGAGTTIFHAGQTYTNGQSFDFGTYQKIWLKCTDVNKFDVVYVYEGFTDVGTSTTIDTLADLYTKDIFFHEDFLNNTDSDNTINNNIKLINARPGMDGGSNTAGCVYMYQSNLWIDGFTSSIQQSTPYYFGNGDFTFKTYARVDQLATTMQNAFLFQLNLLNQLTWNTFRDITIFYDALGLWYGTASPNWQFTATSPSNVRTTVASSIPVIAGQLVTLKIVVKSNLSVEYYIDNVLLYTRPSSLGITDKAFPNINLTVRQEGGHPIRSAIVDYFQVSKKFNTPRS